MAHAESEMMSPLPRPRRGSAVSPGLLHRGCLVDQEKGPYRGRRERKAGEDAGGMLAWSAVPTGGGAGVNKIDAPLGRRLYPGGHPRSLAAGCERSLADRGTSEGRQPLAPEASKSGYVLG